LELFKFINKSTKGGKIKMGKILMKTEIKRKSGMLYYCGTDKDGNITVCSAPMARRGKAAKKSKK